MQLTKPKSWHRSSWNWEAKSSCSCTRLNPSSGYNRMEYWRLGPQLWSASRLLSLTTGHQGGHCLADSHPRSLWGGKGNQPAVTDLVLARDDSHGRKADQKLWNLPSGKTWDTKMAGSRHELYAGCLCQKVAMDLVGFMSETSRGNKWILVLMDHFTT